jgi:hypothetical protein
MSTENPTIPFELDAGQEYTYPELLAMLQTHGEIILTISEMDVEALRAGLTVRKSKERAKLKAKGVPVDDAILEFVVYPSKKIRGAKDVHIKLAGRSGIRVLNMELPEDDISVTGKL